MAKKEIKTQTIEEILADHTPTSEAVKSAVQRYNEERKKKQEQIIIDTLGAVDSIVADHVEHLRSIRAEEKRAQQRILNITAAKEAYLARSFLVIETWEWHMWSAFSKLSLMGNGFLLSMFFLTDRCWMVKIVWRHSVCLRRNIQKIKQRSV